MKRFVCFVMIVFLGTSAFAQSVKPTGPIRRNISTVLLIGLSGAAAGAATLAFYNKPEDHIGNIWLGLTLGLIGGGVYIASRPEEKSYLSLSPAEKQFHTMAMAQVRLKPSPPNLYQMTFDF